VGVGLVRMASSAIKTTAAASGAGAANHEATSREGQ
jgi:hypothetical protein